MTRQNGTSRSRKSIATAVLIGLGLTVLFGAVEEVGAQLRCLLGASGWGVLGGLSSFAPTALHGLVSYTFDFERSLHCPLQMLTSLWPLLTVVAGAI